MIKKYNKLKKENEQNVVIIKSGMFYNAFHEDAVIISYLTNYKLFYNNNNLCVSFTDKSLSLVLSRLRLRKISYTVLNNRNKEQFMGRIIEYNKLLKEAKQVFERELLIDRIIEELKTMKIDFIKDIYEKLERE